MKCTHKEQYEFIQYTGSNEDEIIKFFGKRGHSTRISKSLYDDKIELDVRYSSNPEVEFENMKIKKIYTLDVGDYIVDYEYTYDAMTPEEFNKYFEVVK